MNLSTEWLSELIEPDLTAEAMAERLTHAGCEVEEVRPVPGGAMLVAEVTANRPDWLCHWGVARELAALTDTEARLPDWTLVEDGPPVEALTRVEVTEGARAFCPRYTARVIQGVTVGESPDWLKRRLESIGQRPINNIVDVTNYVLFETNEPLHTFDYDLLAEHRIVVRMAEAGETFRAITGEQAVLAADRLVIADADKPVALAGVKGGANTEVHAGTTNILLEAAYFQPEQVRRASRAARMDSESSYRFERGVDPGLVERASSRAAQLICEVAGGTVATGVIDTAPDLARPWELELRFARCEKLLGKRIEPVPMGNIFRGLGLEVLFKDAAKMRVRVPTHRQDLTREIDLIEEVIRVTGYDRIPVHVQLPLTPSRTPPFVAAARTARDTLVGLGYHECVTDAFVPAAWLEGVPADGEPLRVDNPVNAERPVLRTALAPSLLDVRRVNRLADGVRLFELGHVYHGAGQEPTHVALLDDRGVAHVRGALEEVLRQWRVEGACTVEVADVGQALAEGSGAILKIADRPVAWFGELARTRQNLHDLDRAPAVLEADLTAILALPRRSQVYTPLPRFPAVRRDIALVVPESVRWQVIQDRVRERPACMEAVEFQSVFRGGDLAPGTKSMAFAMRFRAPDRSLTDDEANRLRDAIVAHLTASIPDAYLRASS